MLRRRSPTQSVEVIVHADAGDVFPGMPSVSDLTSQIYWATYRDISDRRLAAEVNVKVLQLGRPVAREHPFGAGACGAADFGLADTCRCLCLGVTVRVFDR